MAKATIRNLGSKLHLEYCVYNVMSWLWKRQLEVCSISWTSYICTEYKNLLCTSKLYYALYTILCMFLTLLGYKLYLCSKIYLNSSVTVYRLEATGCHHAIVVFMYVLCYVLRTWVIQLCLEASWFHKFQGCQASGVGSGVATMYIAHPPTILFWSN